MFFLPTIQPSLFNLTGPPKKFQNSIADQAATFAVGIAAGQAATRSTHVAATQARDGQYGSTVQETVQAVDRVVDNHPRAAATLRMCGPDGTNSFLHGKR